MSVKRKKGGLVISWQKSFSILTAWRKKGGRDEVLDSDIVLTKMKLFSNFHERLLKANDSVFAISRASVSDQDISDLTETSEGNFHLNDQCRQPQMESASNYLSDIFSKSQLLKFYKFESEDSGVELPSGANSPSTPTGSEQSFLVHSRESSCDSCNSACTTFPNKLVTNSQSYETKQATDSMDNSVTPADTQNNMFTDSPSALTAEIYIGQNVNQCRTFKTSPEGEKEKSEQLEETSAVTQWTCSEDIRPATQSSMRSCDDFESNPVGPSATNESLEEYMDECYRLSESNPLCSGLGYLKHICQLIEMIGQLQETNLRLQRKICSLQKDNRMTKTKEQHCSCGAASLAFQDFQKRCSKSECLSPSGTLSDLSTIPEVTRHPLISAKKLSENYTMGRIKDLLRKTKFRNQSRLERTSTSMKMSCPQLYPDLGPVEPAGRNRNSMIALGHHSKLDFPWLQ
uniref:Si:ch211-250c4.4 n=1 Tax=Amphiprion percula TaxID=161767 RepID=A0A3P8RQ84_AMPPE